MTDLFAVGLAKYSPDQPRDEDGRWTDSGGGASGSHSVSTVAAAASSVHPDDPQSAERFLDAARGFVEAVKEGKVEPTQSMWDRILGFGGKVLERLADSVEVVAISAGAGAAVGALTARAFSRSVGFRIGAAVAGVLGVALLYKEWVSNQSSSKLKLESARLKNSVQELEYAFAQFKSQRDGSD